MQPKKQKSRILRIAALSTALLVAGNINAEEQEPRVQNPDLTAELQILVQAKLNAEIERKTTSMWTTHQMVPRIERFPETQVWYVEHESNSKSANDHRSLAANEGNSDTQS